MFWEGPGASRNGQGLTLAVTVRPDGNGEITNHQARMQLRVGDVQLVVQASCCDIDPSQFTSDQREALDVVLTAMVERLRDELGIAGECEDEEIGEPDEDCVGEGDEVPYGGDPWEYPREGLIESEDDADGDRSVGDYTDDDLAAMEQEKLMELLVIVEDDAGAKRILPHITDQKLLYAFWGEHSEKDFDSDVSQRLAACMVADGAVAVEHDECLMDLGMIASTCEGDELDAFIAILTEEQRWDVIDTQQLQDDQLRCVLARCTNQKHLSDIVHGAMYVYGVTVRRVALGRMTDAQGLKDLLDTMSLEDGFIVEVRERYLAVSGQA